MRLSEAAQAAILGELAKGFTPTELARTHGIPRTTITEVRERAKRPAPPPAVNEAAAALIPKGLPALEVRPLSRKLPPAVTETTSRDGIITAVLFGDEHKPFHDPRAKAIVARLIWKLLPNVIGMMGDHLDVYSLSRFDKNPARLHSLQDEIDMVRADIVELRETSPDSRVIYLEGNHEDRLRRTLWNLPEQARVLTTLRNVNEALTWPKLLDTEALGIEFVPYAEQAKRTFLPKWILKHGNVVRKNSAYTARGELDKYNRSGSSGHTHRLGMCFHNDHNGTHCWVETGCTCILTPEYVPDPDWQQGCVVLEFDKETGAFSATPVYIHNGLAVFRGSIIRA